MTNAVRTTTGKRAPMDSMRKTALVAGLFYLLTFVSIPSLALYAPVKTDPNFIISAGATADTLPARTATSIRASILFFGSIR